MKTANLIRWGALETQASGALWIAGCRCQSCSLHTETYPQWSQ
jgi:hypothetical protein